MWIAERILVPVDGSAESMYALRMAVDQAAATGAEVLALHVWELSPRLDPNLLVRGDDGVIKTLREHISDEAAGDLTSWLEPYQAQIGDKLVGHVIEGQRTGAICEAAIRLDVDLVVMGTHGRSGLARFFMGSVAEDVLRNAPCPVLTVKLRDEAPRMDPPSDQDHDGRPYVAPHRYAYKDSMTSSHQPLPGTGPIW